MVKTKKGVSVADLSHPNSRKVRQLTKQIKKESARKKSKLVHQMKQNLTGERFLWFRDNLPQEVTVLDHATIASLVKRYLGRFDEELEQIQLKHSVGQRKNRQHASREDIIKLTKIQEEAEYKTSGIELPNLLQPAQVELLQKWNGELRFLQNFKLRRFSDQFLKSEALKSRPSSPIEVSSNTISDESSKETSKLSNKDGNSAMLESMETDLDENKC